MAAYDNQTPLNIEKKLFLLDAFALIYRAYFAFGKNHRYNSKGFNTSAILGFTNTLFEVIRKEKPTHIAVVYDAPVMTIREKEYADYKAGREEMPEDIRSALPYILKVIDAFNIPVLLSEGYEADDVIGTLAKEAEKRGFTTYMMTPDKDFAQLVSDNIFMYKPARGGNPPEVWGVPEVLEKFQIDNPLQVIDILGLWGDAVDNIPGIPGIGEKTSKILVKKYGSVEGLIAHTNELKGKQKENVINFAEQGLMSKKLATIILDVPVEFKEEDLKLQDPNSEKIVALFSELEFRTLAKRVLGKDLPVQSSAPSNGQLDLFGNASPTPEQVIVPEDKPQELQSIETVEVNYVLVDKKADQIALAEKLNQQQSFCFDTETTGVNPLLAELVGFSFCFQEKEAYYIPVSENYEQAKETVALFQACFENENIEKIAQNIKYDYLVLSRYNLTFKGAFFDTMIAHYLLQPEAKHGMDDLALNYLNYQPVPIESLIGKKGKNQGSMRDISPEKVVDYACEDADITFQLKQLFEKEMLKDEYKKLFYDMEMPLARVLGDMEQEGINLDVIGLAEFSKELGVLIENFHKEIIAEAGTEFNLDSPKQLGQVLFEVLKISDKPKKTKTGQYATGEDVLSKLAKKHPIVSKILDYRSVKKLKSTYVDALPALVNPNTHRLHTTYMQAVAATGRLSSNNPNLQNIPIRTEQGRKIRAAFIRKSENHTLLAADYSQIELRIIAALSEDENMQQAFIEKIDIHAVTAAKVFNVALDEVDREMRSKAKAVNFGIIYGQSAFGLSQNLNIPRKEAKEIIESYFNQFPKLKAYMDGLVEGAKKTGYVETILGRKRFLKDINSNNAIVRGHAERNAVNAPIQGSAADVIKRAMIDVQQMLKEENFKTKMLLQVHDELVFDVPNEELEKVIQKIKEKMENAVKIAVPLDVEVGIGKNWLEAH